MKKNKLPKKNTRIFSTWRKDLTHHNKARDNHFIYIGKKYDITLLVPEKAILGSHILNSKVNIVYVRHFPKKLYLISYYSYAIAYFIKHHRMEKYDIVWAVIGEEPIGWLLKKISWPRVKLVYDLWDIPGTNVERGKSYLKEVARKIYQAILRCIIKHGDAVFACIKIDGLKRYKIPKNRIICSENGVLLEKIDPDKVIPNRTIWSELNGKTKLLYTGYLHKTRGVFELIDAVHRLLQEGINVCLLLVGPCSLRTSLQIRNAINRYHLEEHIRIIENVSSIEVPGIIAASDICFCPLWDIEKFRWSYPVKTYEYLAMGKPVIASNLPGVSHIVKDGKNGLLHEPGNTNALSDCIARIVEDDHLYQSIAIRARESVQDKQWYQVLAPIRNELIPRMLSSKEI
jgi:glycosyltransferase involved in cell wall biosynthesis